MQNPKNYIFVFTISFLCLMQSGCGSERMSSEVEQSLRKGEQFELISLDPDPDAKGEEKLDEWTVIGKTTITDDALQNDLTSTLKKGIAQSRGAIGLCFFPRHGIRVVHEDQVHEYIICFKCLQAQHFIDGQRQDGIILTRYPQEKFDAVLTNAGIPLAEDYIPQNNQ